jgi:C4-dicarboxylate-specific signal transduction histidine kinase
MGYALSADLLRAKQLVVELSERELRPTWPPTRPISAPGRRDIVRDSVQPSRKLRELFGFAPEELLNAEQLVQRVRRRPRGFRDRLSARRREGAAKPERVSPRLARRPAALDRRARARRLRRQGQALRSRGACIDITARKEAEQEMLRLRQDIAHVGRVSVMGQISAALAHEINQPLGAILRNAEAAALFMQHESPDLQEISAILEDIRKDDQRASAVIDRIRALLRHGEVVMATLNVRSVLGDVATLLWPDAAARHVALELTVPADIPAVRGDQCESSRCCSTSSSTGWTLSRACPTGPGR